MAHIKRIDWFSFHARTVNTISRRLHCEHLEDRCLLSISPWTAVEQLPAISLTEQSLIRATDFDTYILDAEQFRAALTGAAPAKIALPNPNGELDWFSVVASSVMAPELAELFPEIQTFRGQGISDPAATLSFDITPAGFHAQVLSPGGSYYIDPYYHLDDSLYAIYAADNKFVVPEFTECGLVLDCGCSDADHSELYVGSALFAASGESAASIPAEYGESSQTTAERSGQFLRTYRIAVAATGEYTAFHGGTVSLGQAAIVTAINRISGIYETELSIRLQLVANNSKLVYTNAGTDPYTNNNPSALLTQNQSNIDSVIGNANYDVGHVFSTGGGGLAALGVVGITGQKARGETGLPSPIGDSFYVDFVAHELGHQFGAEHTFNGDSGNCTGSNRNGSTAYEPGSGSTIMAYAGICGNDDLQAHSDPYFHSASFDQIIAFVDNRIPFVGTRTATGNSIPTVEAGSNFTIPAQTPFILTAAGNDANGDALTYNWEERDLGPQRDVNAGDNGSSPLFRSFLPTTDPSRMFPRLPELLNSTTVVGEQLPTTTRTMNFRATVRDNRSGGGGVNTDNMTVSVVNTGAAFAVTAPNTAIDWPGLSKQTIAWNVAGTTANGINTDLVNILLSTDGGNTFPVVLAGNTLNDGSQEIVLPNIGSTTARIKVEAVGNIYFDISNTDFTIVEVIPGIDLLGSSFQIEPANLYFAGGQTSASFTVRNQGSAGAEAFDVKFYLSDDAAIDPGSDMLLSLDPSDPNYDVLEPSAYHVSGGLAPATSHSGMITLAVPLSDPFGTGESYYIGMFVDADNDLSESDETNNSNLGAGQDGEDVHYSPTFSNLTDINIPATGTSGVAGPYPSTVSVSGLAGEVIDIKVSLLGLTHTYPDDVDILLVGPAGQKIILLSDVGGNENISGVNLIFDDVAVSSLPSESKLTSGTFRPTNIGSNDTFASPAPSGPYASSLATFNGSNPNGMWSLYVFDDSSTDVGVLDGWELQITTADTAAPVITINWVSTDDSTPELTGTVDDPTAMIEIDIDDQLGLVAINNGDGTWTLPDNTITELATGTYDVVARATDAALNVGIDSTIDELTIVTPILPGDYNDDRWVDAADYVLFRKYQGTSGLLPNDEIGGVIGQEHYDQWMANFGTTFSESEGETVAEANFASSSAVASEITGKAIGELERVNVHIYSDVASGAAVANSGSRNSAAVVPRRSSRVLADVGKSDEALIGWLTSLSSHGGTAASYAIDSFGRHADDAVDSLLNSVDLAFEQLSADAA